MYNIALIAVAAVTAKNLQISMDTFELERRQAKIRTPSYKTKPVVLL